MSLTKQATKGMMWAEFSQISIQVVSFTTTLILARLLFPEDFGLIGIVTIFVGVTALLTELGVGASIIQKKNITEDHLSTCFWIALFLGVFLYLIIQLISPFIADFFQEEAVCPLLNMTSLVFILSSFGNIHGALLVKNLRFKKIAVSETSAILLSSFIAVWMAYHGFGVWSLAWRIILNTGFYTLFLWVVNPWRPQIIFKLSCFRELFGFSRNVVGSNLIRSVSKNLDQLIIGKFLGVAFLGYYSFAYKLISFPTYNISRMVTRVTFPIFSLIQEEGDRLKQGYLKVIRYTSIITFPMVAGIFIVSPELIPIALGERWIPAILPIQILCLAGAIQSMDAITTPVILAKGRSDIELKLTLLKLIALIVAVAVGINHGIVGIAIMVSFVWIFLFFFIQKKVNNILHMNFRSYFQALLPAISCSAIMGISVMCFKEYHFPPLPDLLLLIYSISLGIIIYCSALLLLFPHVFFELKPKY